MKFRLEADSTFYAEDIYDAFNKIAQHFLWLKSLSNGEVLEDPKIFQSGSLEIIPLVDIPDAL